MWVGTTLRITQISSLSHGKGLERARNNLRGLAWECAERTSADVAAVWIRLSPACVMRAKTTQTLPFRPSMLLECSQSFTIFQIVKDCQYRPNDLCRACSYN